MIGLETEFTLERRLDGALETALAVGSSAPDCDRSWAKYTPGEGGTTELGLDEELAIENGGRRVEGRARNGGVNIVLSGSRVGNEEPDDLELIKATSVVEAGKDLVDGVCISRECMNQMGVFLACLPKGSGTRPSGAGWVASGRPMKAFSGGAPGQFETPMAPANWML